MNLNEMSYTRNQKNIIYREMLQPLKLKISQILLYDTEAAIEFLNEYNEITKNANDFNEGIISRIADLEFKITQYENLRGSQKRIQGQTQAILQDIEELDSKNHQLTIDDFGDAFSTLQEKYKGLENYDFHERDIIENKFHELQVTLISRLLQEKKDVSLEEIIQEQDRNGLSIAINGKINQFMQSEDFRVKNKAQKIRNIFMTNNVALYSRAMWQLLSELETGKISEANIFDTTLPSSTALTIAPKRQDISPLQKISRLFSKEPQLPLQIGDLKKINIDWLAKHIPQQMLEESEIERLQAEGKRTNRVFIPDARTPIYDMFAFTGENDPKAEVRETKYWDYQIKETLLRKSRLFKYKYIDNNGIEKTFTIVKHHDYKEDGKEAWTCISPDLEIISGSEKFTKSFADDYNLEKIIDYAQLIDKALGTNWTGSLLKEVEDFSVSENSYIQFHNDSKELKIYRNLRSSYYRMKEEYERTKLDFRGIETARREKFYKKFSFGGQQRESREEIGTHNVEVHRGDIGPSREEDEEEDRG
ncbi:MAG: hypothetical protein ACI4VQ_00210 [Clostridia bacterium]